MSYGPVDFIAIEFKTDLDLVSATLNLLPALIPPGIPEEV